MDSKEKLIIQGRYCPDCNCATVLRNQREIYGGNRTGRLYYCPSCGASVHCHPGTERAMGRVADSELRRLRHIAHIWFDALWINKLKKSRFNAYSWLTLKLDMNKDNVHIGYFDKETCRCVIEICASYIHKRNAFLFEKISVEVEEYSKKD